MKNKIIIIILLLVLFPSIIFAEEKEEYINDNNVVIPMETYNNLKKMYTPTAIQVMTQEEFDDILSMNLDFNNVSSVTKYYKTTYNNLTGTVINEEIAKSDIDLTASPKASSYISTSYKALTLTSSSGTGSALISLSLVWLNFPSVRSYDVIGIRTINSSVIYGSQVGKQIYTQSGINHTISYAYNGTNINNQSSGFGISMNLVDPSVTHLECDLSASVSLSSGSHYVYGSYEHATSNISLNTSKDYTIAAGGLGNVFAFNNGYSSYYDNMSGVYINF